MALVANDTNAGAANTAFVNDEFAASPPRAVTIPIGVVDFAGPIRTQAINGCGRFVCPTSTDGYPDDTAGGGRSVLRQRTAGVPLLILSGAGFVCNDPLLWLHNGAGAAAAIEVEGRPDSGGVASGRHTFQNQMFRNWDIGARALNGYYDPLNSYAFVDDIAEHADHCTFRDCEFSDIGTIFRSQNVNALSWIFDSCVGNVLGVARPTMIVYDCVKGGVAKFPNLHLNHVKTTLIKLGTYSPNTAYASFRDLTVDRTLVAGSYLRLIDGTDAAAGDEWVLVFSGRLPPQPVTTYYDELFYNASTLSRAEWNWRDLRGLPEEYVFNLRTNCGIGIGV